MSLRLIEVFAELEVGTNRRKAASGATPVK